MAGYLHRKALNLGQIMGVKAGVVKYDVCDVCEVSLVCELSGRIQT